ncbi:MAG TPA: hypothetical protein VJX29_13425 [Candidatus Acidoferrales bacterium]|nr:hypothetical protein [Candidatus Acidoferrales bacterium]
MKTLLFSAILLLTLSVRAQVPASSAAVAIKDEPHHHLVLENAYVRAWHFEIAGHDTTLLHAHDLPYLAVALMPGDFVNGVAGKPEAHVTADEGQLNYSKGGFAHFVRTDAGTPFQNFTIELLKPQGTPRNRCIKVIDGPFDCPVEAAGKPVVETPAFETDELLVEAGALPLGRFYNAESSPFPRLFIILSDSQVSVEPAGSKATKLHGGDLYWLPAGTSAAITEITPQKKKEKDRDARDEMKLSRFYIVVFKDAGGAK